MPNREMQCSILKTITAEIENTVMPRVRCNSYDAKKICLTKDADIE